MLALQIAAEINQRWDELEKLSSLDRLHVLETLIERNILATGPCCSSSYVPSYQCTSDFDSRPMEENAKRH